MRDSNKRLAVIGGEDRLTGLPSNLLHQIQECMSIEDAARMSVLSSPWRYVWSSQPKLIFNNSFCKKRTLANTMDIISTILLQHQGAIKQFLVDMSITDSSGHSVVDEWMLLLSRNGLLDLSLEVSALYILPSYVYGLGLERLVLSKCIFRPPCSFRGFGKLRRLTVNEVAFELDVATSSLWMPNLERLIFLNCTGLHLLNICAPELILLYFYGCGTETLNFSHFIDCMNLETVGFVPENVVSLNRQNREMTWTKVLNSWRNLSWLLLGGYFLKFFVSGTGAETPVCLTGLTRLSFVNYIFEDEDQISPLLCILKSSPNLKFLQFASIPRKRDDAKMDVNYFEGKSCTAEGLHNLQKLLINNLCGSRTEMHFVRFVLASTPLLREAYLSVDTSVSKNQSMKISEELMCFPRASPLSKVICRPMSSTSKGRSTILRDRSTMLSFTNSFPPSWVQ